MIFNSRRITALILTIAMLCVALASCKSGSGKDTVISTDGVDDTSFVSSGTESDDTEADTSSGDDISPETEEETVDITAAETTDTQETTATVTEAPSAKNSHITVSKALSLSKITGAMSCGGGVHGGHQTRILRTSRGTYAAYITRDNLLKTDGHWEFVLVKVDGEKSRVLYRDFTPYDSVYIMADKNEDIYLVTGTSTTRYDPYETETAQATVWKYNEKNNTMQGYTTRTPFPQGFSFGYMTACLDAQTRKITIMYSGGNDPGYFAWNSFDLDSREFAPNVNLRIIPYRHCYSYMFPDGKGGITILSERDVKSSTPSLDRPVNKDTYIFDSLHLFTISDLTSADTGAYTETVVADPDYSTVYRPQIENNNTGDTFLDAAGRLHVVYSAVNNGAEGTAKWHAVIENGKVKYRDKFSFDQYCAARMTQTRDGTFYLLRIAYTSTQLEIYEAKDVYAREWKLAGTYDLGIDKQWTMYYSGLVITSPRNGSLADDIVCGMFPMYGGWQTFTVNLRDYS